VDVTTGGVGGGDVTEVSLHVTIDERLGPPDMDVGSSKNLIFSGCVSIAFSGYRRRGRRRFRRWRRNRYW
jgi:hypothetical protein